MKKLALLLLPFFIQTALAADGSWEGSGANVVISQRGIATSSPVMRSQGALPPGRVVTSIHWNYKLQALPPSGMRVALCTPGLCVPLDGGSGRTQALQGIDANNPLYFLYQLPGKGAIRPPVRVLSYQVLVNYRDRD
ncbi:MULTISPECIES: flagellar protein FlhE [unclassified Brenneria]|uniref:flagellar protein FlhE n=1 Tax=unclassified Brenneria TaxID=2634434 RepID=UPI001554F448|nr:MULTISPECIES: flagellar protein FlhE [unclassified Brenneria]MBJ7220401.1 flagellar protein FlhE [Brenneria sp. L3-3C-1]MEE3641645.1 flagellar protein FlhE [Brenneria sp. L3_3C_1]MEE3649724.1 flagellar protein FlhE [Brenneria sp. HEZEL_4_2_4]NPC99682.1 flagellar protein FlhE [Brenneria sp. hezel4-2-4]